jgi:hypothetical protein
MKRRDFLSTLLIAGAAFPATLRKTLVPSTGEAAPRPRPAIVSFHLDQPYLDTSGTAMPYHPPSGMRSGEPVARLTEEAFRKLQYCV